MNFIAFMSFSVLVIIILTLVFGIVSYFLYKMRERQKRKGHEVITYEDLKSDEGREFLYLEEVEIK